MIPKALLALLWIVTWLPALDAGFAEDVDIHTLTSIDYEEGDPLPESVTQLDGKEVTIEGYMHLFSGKADTFLIGPDPCGCVGRPKIQEFIAITLDNEEATWSSSPVTIKGTLSVGEVKEGGFVTSIYRLEGNLD